MKKMQKSLPFDLEKIRSENFIIRFNAAFHLMWILENSPTIELTNPDIQNLIIAVMGRRISYQ